MSIGSGERGISLATCFGEAGVSNVSWITITSPCCGIGNGTVAYTVAPNSGTTGRGGTITIAGKTFTVKQKGS